MHTKRSYWYYCFVLFCLGNEQDNAVATQQAMQPLRHCTSVYVNRHDTEKRPTQGLRIGQQEEVSTGKMA